VFVAGTMSFAFSDDFADTRNLARGLLLVVAGFRNGTSAQSLVATDKTLVLKMRRLKVRRRSLCRLWHAFFKTGLFAVLADDIR
jgi:hypothetical protein